MRFAMWYSDANKSRYVRVFKVPSRLMYTIAPPTMNGALASNTNVRPVMGWAWLVGFHMDRG